MKTQEKAQLEDIILDIYDNLASYHGKSKLTMLSTSVNAVFNIIENMLEGISDNAIQQLKKYFPKGYKKQLFLKDGIWSSLHSRIKLDLIRDTLREKGLTEGKEEDQRIQVTESFNLLNENVVIEAGDSIRIIRKDSIESKIYNA